MCSDCGGSDGDDDGVHEGNIRREGTALEGKVGGFEGIHVGG